MIDVEKVTKMAVSVYYMNLVRGAFDEHYQPGSLCNRVKSG